MIKKKEIEISLFYDWNICMMTFYDFLEQMMMMGLLFANDQISVYSNASTDDLMNFSNTKKTRKSVVENEDSGNEEDLVSPRSPSPSYKVEGSNRSTQNESKRGSHLNSPLVIKNTKANLFSPCSNIKNITDYDSKELDLLVENIERRCLDLAQQVSFRYLTDATIQKEMAYLIVAAARRDNGVIDYDSEFLREFFQVEIREEQDFNSKLSLILDECPDLSNQLLFDLVIRQYTPDGREIVPPFFLKQIEEERMALAELDRREREKAHQLHMRQQREQMENRREEREQMMYLDKKSRKSCDINKKMKFSDKKNFRRSYNPHLQVLKKDKSQEKKSFNNRQNIKVKRQYVNLGIGENREYPDNKISEKSYKTQSDTSDVQVKRVGIKVDPARAEILIGDKEMKKPKKKPTLTVLIQNHRRKVEKRARSRSQKKKLQKKVNQEQPKYAGCSPQEVQDIASPRDYSRENLREWRNMTNRTKSRPKTGLSRTRGSSPAWNNTASKFSDRSSSYNFNNPSRPFSRRVNQRETPSYQQPQNYTGYNRNSNRRYVSPAAQMNSPRNYNYDGVDQTYSPFKRVQRNSQRPYQENSTYKQRSPFMTAYDSTKAEPVNDFDALSKGKIKETYAQEIYDNNVHNKRDSVFSPKVNNYNQKMGNSPVFRQQQNQNSPGAYDYNAPSNYSSRIMDINNRSQIGYDYGRTQQDNYQGSPRVSNYKTNNSMIGTVSPSYHQNYQRRYDQGNRANVSSPYQRNSNMSGLNNRANLAHSPLNDNSAIYNNANNSVLQQRRSGQNHRYLGNRTGGYENSGTGGIRVGRKSVNSGAGAGYFRDRRNRMDYNASSGSKYGGGFGYGGDKGYNEGGLRYTGLGR